MLRAGADDDVELEKGVEDVDVRRMEVTLGKWGDFGDLKKGCGLVYVVACMGLVEEG